jgi:ABC-type transport system involved in multi-copper enzyme maturation permease subunit
MKAMAINFPVVRLLVAKDWQLFEKQLAAYVAAGIVALCFLGHAKPWSFYFGSLLLLVVLVAAACFAISNSLLVERKEHTLAFVMSLPVSPLDFYLSKLLGNLVTFGVPFVVIAGGTLGVIVLTPLPDGLVVYALLIFGHILLAYCISLGVAMAVESEGWNTFTMIASMVLVNPFIMLLGQFPAIVDNVKTEDIVWSAPALTILGVQVVLGLSALVATAWVHCRKPSFY